MQVLTTTVARVLFALPFGIFGFFHFANGSAMAGYVPSFIPGGVLWVYLTGLALVLACISIIIQKYMKWSCMMLAVMLALFILLIHLPGAMAGNEASVPAFLKDLGLTGGALTYAGLAKD